VIEVWIGFALYAGRKFDQLTTEDSGQPMPTRSAVQA
jgi:hypothetical protein